MPDAADAAQSYSFEHEPLWQALRSLPPRQRAVIVLRYYAGLSEVDIAAALGVSQGTVKIGMSLPAALDTGLLEASPSAVSGSCAQYQVANSPDAGAPIRVDIDQHDGVVAIHATRQLETKRGVHLGSTLAEVTRPVPGHHQGRVRRLHHPGCQAPTRRPTPSWCATTARWAR